MSISEFLSCSTKNVMNVMKIKLNTLCVHNKYVMYNKNKYHWSVKEKSRSRICFSNWESRVLKSKFISLS